MGTLNINIFFGILVIAVLLFIAAELYVIARELSRGITLMLNKREKNEVLPTTGQTINVNLASGSTTTTDATPGAAIPQTTETEPEQSSSSGNETVMQESIIPIPIAIPSGKFAVKCPVCGAENSNYRRECFSCGIAL